MGTAMPELCHAAVTSMRSAPPSPFWFFNLDIMLKIPTGACQRPDDGRKDEDSTMVRIMPKLLINDRKAFPVTKEFKEFINLSITSDAERDCNLA